MHQVLQDVRSGELSLSEVPPPSILPGCVRVRTGASLISAGTERGMIELAKKSLAGKARARPDLVRQVVDKAKREGVVQTINSVFARMERPMPLGYSAAGVVEEVGEGVSDFRVGDRVAIAGAGYANHAEVNCVPANLVAHIPEGVTFESAAYTTVASIAMQGVRIARPEIGEFVAVVGQGLIGLITTQILVAAGCRVIGIDPDSSKGDLAKSFGAEAVASSPDEAERIVARTTGGRLADYVIITAATKSSGPIELAGRIARRKGSVVVVGAVGMQIPRDEYYKKELDLRISMSYGPGRYDSSYEEGGTDYPYDYVRWTEQRNMTAVLALMQQGRLNVAELTTHQFGFHNALDAYELITSGAEPHIGIVLGYDLDKPQSPVLNVTTPSSTQARDCLEIGFIGAGNYASSYLLPHLVKRTDVELAGLVTATGLNAEQKARKFGFQFCTTSADEVIGKDSIASVFVATRHGTHAEYVVRCLNAGKHVFVEKPLAVNEQQLADIERAWLTANEKDPLGLMVGLNRRFAPSVDVVKSILPANTPMHMVYRVNSGHIPTSTWLHEASEGGGMLVGEMCHFIDLMMYLTGSSPVRVAGSCLNLGQSEIADLDNVTLTISFDDGSVGSLNYNTIGTKSAPKERLEVFCGGHAAMLDDFRSVTTYVDGKRQTKRSGGQDKGQRAMVAATIEGFRTRGQAPIPFDQLMSVMRTVFAARRAIVSRTVEEVNASLSGAA